MHLATNEKRDLFIFLEQDRHIQIKTLVGTFSLHTFVLKDLRNLPHLQGIFIDQDALEGTQDDILRALETCRVLHADLRVIMISAGQQHDTAWMTSLIQLGITNIVTATTATEAQKEIQECLSYDGMQRWLSKIPQGPTTPQYRWRARNVRMRFTGLYRHIGTTTVAMNFAQWLSSRGAKVAFVVLHRHDDVIQLFSLQRGITFSMTDDFDQDFHFIIYDGGSYDEYEATIRVHHDIVLATILPQWREELQTFMAQRNPDVVLANQGNHTYMQQLAEMVKVTFISHCNDWYEGHVNSDVYDVLSQGYRHQTL